MTWLAVLLFVALLALVAWFVPNRPGERSFYDQQRARNEALGLRRKLWLDFVAVLALVLAAAALALWLLNLLPLKL
jgi:hypothetical protein